MLIHNLIIKVEILLDSLYILNKDNLSVLLQNEGKLETLPVNVGISVSFNQNQTTTGLVVLQRVHWTPVEFSSYVKNGLNYAKVCDTYNF